LNSLCAAKHGKKVDRWSSLWNLGSVFMYASCIQNHEANRTVTSYHCLKTRVGGQKFGSLKTKWSKQNCSFTTTTLASVPLVDYIVNLKARSGGQALESWSGTRLFLRQELKASVNRTQLAGVSPGMPPNVQSPVHIHKPVAVPDGVNGKGVSSGGFSIMCRRQVGRRRIFVQTDTGRPWSFSEM
jgi:hypothetical protein